MASLPIKLAVFVNFKYFYPADDVDLVVVVVVVVATSHIISQ